jgi:hypothetical protein
MESEENEAVLCHRLTVIGPVLLLSLGLSFLVL